MFITPQNFSCILQVFCYHPLNKWLIRATNGKEGQTMDFKVLMIENNIDIFMQEEYNLVLLSIIELN